MKKIYFSLIIFLSINSFIRASDFRDRYNFNAMLEPVGKVMNGAGQSPDAFQNYWNVMKETNKPIIYMYYVGLKGIRSNWSNVLKTEVLKYQHKFVIPQIGLAMTYDGNPESHYEDDVAAGLLDQDIDQFLDGLEKLAMPVYLRIGYEFNGLSWNGYQPETYKQAFIRITEKIRARNREIATVWHYSADGEKNFMDYYPGDEYVDWWGISTFSVNSFSDYYTISFHDSAVNHAKPVMIGESTPRYVGVLNGENSWNEWFVPYFDFIHSRPEIKTFCYINWNWTNYPQWEDWGDCRLEQNEFVKEHFSNEMDSTSYLHALPENEFRKTLGYDDDVAPEAISNITVIDSTFPPIIKWDEVTDPSGIAHYIIYNDKGIEDYTLKPYFEIVNIKEGETRQYYISVMDRAGNESPVSEMITVQLSGAIDKIINGEFDDGFTAWNRDAWYGSAVFDIDTTSLISGKNSAHIKITSSSGTNWHIQLRQWMKVFKGKYYIINYKAKANKIVTIETWLQMDHSPYHGYAHKHVTLTPEVQSFSDTAFVNTNDNVYLAFMVGHIGLAEIWIDAVSVIETSDISHVGEYISSNIQEFKLLNAYPNPFNSTTIISYILPERAYVSLSVYNVLGQFVTNLVDEFKDSGRHSVIWDASNMRSGIYFYKMTYGSDSKVGSCILLR